MKYTLLEMTQSILSAMDSDEINSITDTTEARQVAEVIRTAYFNITSRANLPEHHTVFSLVASADADQPVVMLRPDNVSRIDWIKYNIKDTGEDDQFTYVTILPHQQFLDMIHSFSTDEANIDIFTFNGLTFYYRTDKVPQYCTIIDDYHIIFDSLDSAEDSTLQESKTNCYGLRIPDFDIADDFTPELDDQQFPLLLNEAKSLAFLELKQSPHEGAVLESRRQWRNLQRTKDLVKPSDFDALPNFGRR